MTATTRWLEPLPVVVYRHLVWSALLEDLGAAGDVTSDAVVPPQAVAAATLCARRPGRLAGLDAALCAFRILDPAIRIDVAVRDGESFVAGTALATLSGSARAIMAAERTALNLLGRLCGVATATAAFVAAAAPHRAAIACTRKTTPGLRALEKYAVRAGGGVNHRFGLYDAVLIKDNHVAIAGGVGPALRSARARAGHLVKIEVEVDTIPQLREALEAGADAVLLDNMSLDDLREAVRVAGGRALLEASGSVTLETVNAIAATGVDLISVGWLTHSAPALDVALDVAPLGTPAQP
jgi:nicotinate-nucleotide pyrophosphorylase (carboxylating)